MIVPSDRNNLKPRTVKRKYFWIGSILFFVASFKFFKTWDIETLIAWDWLLAIRVIGLLLISWSVSSILGEDNKSADEWIIRSNPKNKDDEGSNKIK